MSSTNMVTFRKSPWSKAHPVSGPNNQKTCVLSRTKTFLKCPLCQKSLPRTPAKDSYRTSIVFTAFCTIWAGEKFPKQDQACISQRQSHLFLSRAWLFSIWNLGSVLVKKEGVIFRVWSPVKQECCKVLAALHPWARPEHLPEHKRSLEEWQWKQQSVGHPGRIRIPELGQVRCRAHVILQEHLSAEHNRSSAGPPHLPIARKGPSLCAFKECRIFFQNILRASVYLGVKFNAFMTEMQFLFAFCPL